MSVCQTHSTTVFKSVQILKVDTHVAVMLDSLLTETYVMVTFFLNIAALLLNVCLS